MIFTGLSEIIGPGVSMECIEAQHGLHIFEDHFMPEIIDPDTGEVLPMGEEGELVFTTLTKAGLPAYPLPDQGYHQAYCRALCLRQNFCAHGKNYRPHR